MSLALGLFVWVGYELGLIFTEHYDPTARETLQPILAVVATTAAVMALTGGMLMRRGKRRRRVWR